MVSSASDEDLIQRIGRGERGAIATFFARHQVRVYRFIARLTGHDAVAEELTNEVFLDVWRQAGRFEGRSAVTTWLLGIARNKALSHMRRRSDAPLDEDYAAGLTDNADTPEIAAQKTDKGALIRKCMEALSRDHREVVDLVYYHECSIAEVAEITGVKQNTVKTRMFHARKKLSVLLAAAGVDRGWP